MEECQTRYSGLIRVYGSVPSQETNVCGGARSNARSFFHSDIYADGALTPLPELPAPLPAHAFQVRSDHGSYQ